FPSMGSGQAAIKNSAIKGHGATIQAGKRASDDGFPLFRLDRQRAARQNPVERITAPPAPEYVIKQFLLKFFTWWTGQTFGTQFTTWRDGERVGEDHLGNVYYRLKGGRIDPAFGTERRWVIYNGEAEASKIPEGWNGWLHHTV